MTWDSVVPVVLGGLCAIGGGILTPWITRRLDDRRERTAIAGALAGEVGAICSIIRDRRYLEGAEQLLTEMGRTRQPQRIAVSVTQDYLRIYIANAGKIGLLPARAARDVARFYTQVNALSEDIRPDTPWPSDLPQATHRVEEFVEMLRDTLKLGDSLVVELLKVAE